LLVLLVGGWGAYRDWQSSGELVQQAAITRVRSHADRTVGRLESQLYEQGREASLADVSQSRWLRERWRRVAALPEREFGAVVDASGRIVAHSDPRKEGQQVPASWSQSPVSAGGIRGVYHTACPVLAAGRQALDVTVPIRFGRRHIGYYHSGINGDWLQGEMAAAQQRSLSVWSLVIGGIAVVVLLSSASLYWLTRRSARLERELASVHTRHVEEVSQLVIGLAHEIRNPMNAVRLNLFTADRAVRGDVDLEPGEMVTMLEESAREIERVDDLMSAMLSYARIGADAHELVDVVSEIDAVQKFLKPSFAAQGIELACEVSGQSALVQAGHGHVRQVLLNLLNNALDAAPRERGRVRLSLLCDARQVQVRVLDNGPGVAADLRERIFAPFFTTKESGTGLGLAIVRRLMEMAGGLARCEDAADGGGCFFVAWPAAHILTERPAG
jgi:signal transduction histidine kinase